MSSSRGTFPRLTRLVRTLTVMALIAPALVGLGLVLFLAKTVALQAVGVMLMSLGGSMGLLGVIFRKRVLSVRHRLERSNAAPSPLSHAIPPLQRLNRILLYEAVLGAVIAGAGVVSFLALATPLHWVGLFLLAGGTLVGAASLWLRRRNRRMINRIRTLSAQDPIVLPSEG